MSGKGRKPSNLEVLEYIGLYGEVGRTHAEMLRHWPIAPRQLLVDRISHLRRTQRIKHNGRKRAPVLGEGLQMVWVRQ